MRLALFLALVAAAPLCAQQAELSGTISDESGGAITGANVWVENVATSVRRSATTNNNGLYRIVPLTAGSYRVTVDAPGFQQKVLEGLRVNVAEKIARSITLRVAQSSQSVTVDGSSINVNTTDAAVSTVVDHQFVENMPLSGRSFQSLMQLSIADDDDSRRGGGPLTGSGIERRYHG